MRFRRAFATSVVALTLMIASAPPAHASPPQPPSPETTSTFMPMMVLEYDAEVAAANGYKIVTEPDGTQYSVPVTPAAVAQQQHFDQLKASTLSAKAGGDAWGDCGGSGISAVKGSLDILRWHTWFTVFGAATSYSWHVSAIGAVSSNFWDMGGAGPASGSKSFDGAGKVVGPGYATVPIWSVVTLASGAVCYSLGPTAWFG
ncbi:hypothetical protein ACI3KT_13740 [Microbacterium sp. ZW T6_19]|uniref:hypothetical protein n=1 Tax=Microbacterium sp. ZW T6_19 TaxID=3378082 RepID=UPI003854C758